ncbi:hypothetical protein DW1_2309 [Proteiniborus sp. DW1]|uniref:DUF5050 domain-containing protein n=1 Tax=Proteiniborus sp. DW1 TaxID=1889883 RepID=UPI00092DF523|nr:DUF5050 domain-containing protein [Proteiniborus sp. DW1]SCG83873.1 hypothetical protein DW1_2309 [Proteiniborus sp. DW1]
MYFNNPKNRGHKLFVLIILIFLPSFSIVSCNSSKSVNETLKTYEVDPIIEIKDVEEEKVITSQVNSFLSNGGGVAYYDNGWIYFSRRKKMNYGDTLEIGELYKMKEDATGVTKLSNDSASNIFVKDDWIYYINNSDFRTFYKIRTDGTDRRKINDEHRMFNFIYIDGWVYFNEYLNKKGQGIGYHGSPGSYLATAFSRMRIDGSDYQRILDIEISDFSYDDKYIYGRDVSYEAEYAQGGIIRIKRDDLRNEKLEKNKINYEIVLENPISGTHLTTLDNRIVYYDIGNDKTCIVEKSIEDSTKKELIDIELYTFNIKNGWLYGNIYFSNEKNNDLDMQIFRLDKNNREILAEFRDNSNTRFSIVGDWILYTAYGTQYALSLDGKETKVLVEPYSAIGDEEKYEAKNKIDEIKEIIEYFSQKGHYNGEYLNFLTIKALENKYPFSNFGVVSEDNFFYSLDDLFKMTPDEISNANIIMEELDILKFRLEYYKTLVENKEEFITIDEEEISDAIEIIDYFRDFLDYLQANNYIQSIDNESKFIDLTMIDEDILFEDIETTSFKWLMRKDIPNKISLKDFIVLNKDGEYYDLEYLLGLTPKGIIDLGIRMEDLLKIKSNLDFIKDVIEKHVG